MGGRKFLRYGLAAGVVLALALLPVVRANDALNQGVTYFKSGKYAEAAAEFQTLVDGSPKYDYGYFMLGLSLLKMGKTADARDNIAKAIGLNGKKFEYHNGLATVYFTEKDYPNAVAALRTAEPLATTDQHRFALFSTRGNAYAALDKWSDAVQDLERARALNPNQTSVLVTLGQSYYKLGHFDKAVPVFREAVRLAPSDMDSLQLLTESLLSLGAETAAGSQKDSLYKEAMKHAEQFQKADPANFEANNLVGRSALGANDFPRAEQSFRKVLAQKPDYCYAMVNLGKTYIAQERWKEAQDILGDAATCAPRMAVVYESLGFALQKQNRLQEAVQAYEKAYNLKPSESVRSAMEICKQNLDVQSHNEMVASEEAAQKAAEEAAAKEYEEKLAKQKEWEERRKKDQ